MLDERAHHRVFCPDGAPTITFRVSYPFLSVAREVAAIKRGSTMQPTSSEERKVNARRAYDDADMDNVVKTALSDSNHGQPSRICAPPKYAATMT
jgi:hypothetical protein